MLSFSTISPSRAAAPAEPQLTRRRDSSSSSSGAREHLVHQREPVVHDLLEANHLVEDDVEGARAPREGVGARLALPAVVGAGRAAARHNGDLAAADGGRAAEGVRHVGVDGHAELQIARRRVRGWVDGEG